ncbi:MAG: putative dehydrogenase [Kangiellaceae bacterium]|jgi:predicted dehydrogenase
MTKKQMSQNTISTPPLSTINWAVLGCGHIAKTFMAGIESVSNATVIACAASDINRAKAFAESWAIPHHFGNYLSMLHERSIHAVYIATTHNFHYENIMLCLQHGKHVLCEKPLTLNAKQAKKAYALAEQNNLLLVEAVWTRFLPAILGLQAELAKNIIGNIQCVQANFSLNRDFPDTHRLNNPLLAGGALLDLGIYPITIADVVFGKSPISITSNRIDTATGVDKNSFYTLQYDTGAVAQLSAGFGMSGPTYATIMGDKGVISVPFFLAAKSFIVTLEGQAPQLHDYHFDESDNFKFEIMHFTQILLDAENNISADNNGRAQRDIRLSSNIMPAQTTLRMMSIMDTIREQWGLTYANEDQ